RDIPAGTFRIRTASAGCYWERLRGFSGSLDDVISNDFTNVTAVVTISPSDAGFHTAGCGTWTNDLHRITPSLSGPLTGGEYILGIDMAAGRWRSSAGNGCYWERVSGFGGTLNEIIANDFTNSPAIVDVASSDRGFHASEGCGTWTKIG